MLDEAGGQRRYLSRRTAIGAVLVLATLVVAGLLAAAIVLSQRSSGSIPPGVTIAGVEVGGDSFDEARKALQPVIDEQLAQSITLVHANGSIETTPEELGAEVQVDRALAIAEGSRHGFNLISARLGVAETVDVPLTVTIEPKRVRALVGDVAEELEQDVTPAAIVVKNGQVVITEGVVGVEIDQPGFFERLVGLPDTVKIPLREVQPKVSTQTAMDAQRRADEIVADLPAVVYNRTRVKLTKRLIRRALQFEVTPEEIVVSLDEEPFKRRLRRAFADLKTEPRNARFQVDGTQVLVVKSKPGTVFDLEKTIDQLIPNVGEKQIRAVYTRIQPDFTTAQAEALGIQEQVSSFTTAYECCEARVSNIQRAAQLIDGTILGAGETFSMNDALGKRTREKGFKPGPTIVGGRLEDTVGGGISQVATTLYNAAFFAGLQLVESRPHSFYISRYPMGREATVSWGGPELVFHNDWDAALLIRAFATDTSVTFAFYSRKLGRRVETTTGEPRDFVNAGTKRIFKPDWEPGRREIAQDGGIRGFTVTYTRQVYRGDDLIKDESWTVKYVSLDKIIEVGPKVPQEEPVEETPPAEAPPPVEPPPEEPPAEPPPPAEEPPPEEPPGEPAAPPAEEPPPE